jgi:hypothetical protein
MPPFSVAGEQSWMTLSPSIRRCSINWVKSLLLPSLCSSRESKSEEFNSEGTHRIAGMMSRARAYALNRLTWINRLKEELRDLAILRTKAMLSDRKSCRA